MSTRSLVEVASNGGAANQGYYRDQDAGLYPDDPMTDD